MKIGLRLPKLGATMQEGKITTWQVKPGDVVQPGDLLCEVESDKATIDVESVWAARIAEIVVEAGNTVPVGTTIAFLEKERT